MAHLAERTVSASIHAYLEGGEISLQVRQWSDTLLNYYDEVGDKAIELITRFQPVARDLRVIRASMEISYSLSRFGRYALDIVTIFRTIGGTPEFGQENVAEMGRRTMTMIESSLEAFRTKNIQLAEKVLEQDDDIDRLYVKHLKDCVKNPPRKTEQLISDVLAVRHLERIADHAVDLASTTLYMIDGRQIVPWK